MVLFLKDDTVFTGTKYFKNHLAAKYCSFKTAWTTCVLQYFFASLKKQERIIAFVKVNKREIVPLSEILTLLLILKNNESTIKLLFLIQKAAY